MGGGGAEQKQHVGGGGAARSWTPVTFPSSAQLGTVGSTFPFSREGWRGGYLSPGELVGSEEVPAY